MSTDAELVARLTAGGRANRGGWINVDCPFCEDRIGKRDRARKLGLNVRTGRYKCFRCEAWGYVKDDRLSVRSSNVASSSSNSESFRPPSSYELPEPGAVRHAKGIAYIKRRGIDDATAQAVGVRLCTRGRDAGRVIIPLKDGKGVWWGWYGRSWNSGVVMPHFYPPGMDRSRMFNEVVVRTRTDEPVMVVEAVLDALPYWPQAVACLGKPGTPQIETLLKAERPVAFCLDGDAWRTGMYLAMQFRHEGRRAGYVKLPPKADPNGLAVERGAEWLKQRARECIEEAL